MLRLSHLGTTLVIVIVIVIVILIVIELVIVIVIVIVIVSNRQGRTYIRKMNTLMHACIHLGTQGDKC